MFRGSLPTDVQSILASSAKNWGQADLYVGCSGNFTVERALASVKEFNTHGNDVTIYSSVAGAYYARQDGALTSVPFCAILGYLKDGDPIQYLEDGITPVYEVLSGNHRVRAAISAGMTEIHVMVTDEPLPEDRRKAIQLSHNNIFGEDDPATLKMIYESIGDLGMRIYSGTDDKLLMLLDKVQPGALGEANLQFQPVSFMFLPDELDQVDKVWELAKREVSGSKRVWLASMKDYDQVMDALEDTGRSMGVKNVATALLGILEVFTRHITDLQENYLDQDGNAMKENVSWAPISTILGEANLPVKVLASLNKAIARTQTNSKKLISKQEALAIILDTYIEGLNNRG